MENWLKTGDGKKIKLLFDGKVTIVSPENTSNIIPLFCPCCNLPMKDNSDSISYRKIKVCNKCDERWTNKPNVKWPDGPDKKSDEWNAYIDNRKLVERTAINFR